MRLERFLITALAASVAAVSFAFPTTRPAPPPSVEKGVRVKTAPGTTRVKGYTYKTKDGKIVTVKAHDRTGPTARPSGTTKVKGYTYKTKDGKIVVVKPHERRMPSARPADTAKVKGYTYKTKDGNIVVVKPHERRIPAKRKSAPKVP